MTTTDPSLPARHWPRDRDSRAATGDRALRASLLGPLVIGVLGFTAAIIVAVQPGPHRGGLTDGGALAGVGPSTTEWNFGPHGPR